MTARDLSQELEVSERTIYRDIDALSIAGIPVYGESGPEGGYALLDSYRTTLTGLSEGEVQALFMLSIPAPLADLGVSQELKAALLKLSASLSDDRRQDEQRVRQRFYLDATWWHQGETAVPHLQSIQQAVWEDRELMLHYKLPFLITEFEHIVSPYGLVAKAGVWYLVCVRQGRWDVHRVSRLLDVRMLDSSFTRDSDFDLAAFWQAWCAEREREQSYYSVIVRVVPNLLPRLSAHFGGTVRYDPTHSATPDAEGRVTVELAFESLEAARDRLLDFGRAVEVLKPTALRVSIQDYAQQILALYEKEI
jgi:predicted DNA-binding transcriptional regulator YafY